MAEKKLLVLGASGYVGSRLVTRLVHKGYKVRAASRSVKSLRKRHWAENEQVELFAVDVGDKEALLKACEGCWGVYYLVHSMNQQHKDFAQADRQAARLTVEAADEKGLKRIVYLGGLGNEKGHLSEHLCSRIEVGKILASGKVPATIFRAAMIIGSGSASFEILRYLVRRLPIMVTPRWVTTESQPIAISNVLHYLTECVNEPQTENGFFDIGGQDILSYQRLMEIFAQEARLMKRVILPTPFLTPKLSSYWIHIVTPVSSYLARPLVEGLATRVVCQEQKIRSILPQRMLTCREAIRKAIYVEPLSDAEKRDLDEGLPPAEWKYPGDPAWVKENDVIKQGTIG